VAGLGYDERIREFSKLLQEMLEEEREFVLAIVVSVKGSAAAKPGAKGIILPDGTVKGWLGGWCSERAVISAALEVLAFGRPKLLKLVMAGRETRRVGEDVIEVSTPCGGEVLLYLEPVYPPPHAVVFGDVRVVKPLARFMKELGFKVTAMTIQREPVESADVNISDVSELEKVRIDDHTYVVLASMGNTDFDMEVLEKVLGRGAAKIYIVASVRRAEEIARRLSRKGVPPEELAKIESPAGVDIGAATPEELALSIAAAIVADRRGGSRRPMEEVKGAPFKRAAKGGGG
jgi:xanthine dehydrogenase accessory factor